MPDHLEHWLAREFGPAAAAKAAPAMQEYYRLCAMRHPEFFGWSQVELSDTQRYPGGLSKPVNTEFSFSEFGGEAQRYIDRFRAVRRAVEDATALVPARSRDAWFAAVQYPVGGAESMAEKMLYAQRARQLSRSTYAPYVWKPDTVQLAAAALSLTAYRDIRERTRQFNEELAGGKWRGLMCDHPRDLPLYWAPDLPVSLTDAEIAKWAAYGQNWHAPEVPASGQDYYAANACDFAAATAPVRPVRSLGHSGRAVPVPKGASLRYDFRTEGSGRAVIHVAVIPTQALDKGDIRFSQRQRDGQRGQQVLHGIQELRGTLEGIDQAVACDDTEEIECQDGAGLAQDGHAAAQPDDDSRDQEIEQDPEDDDDNRHAEQDHRLRHGEP